MCLRPNARPDFEMVAQPASHITCSHRWRGAGVAGSNTVDFQQDWSNLFRAA